MAKAREKLYVLSQRNPAGVCTLMQTPLVRAFVVSNVCGAPLPQKSAVVQEEEVDGEVELCRGERRLRHEIAGKMPRGVKRPGSTIRQTLSRDA